MVIIQRGQTVTRPIGMIICLFMNTGIIFKVSNMVLSICLLSEYLAYKVLLFKLTILVHQNTKFDGLNQMQVIKVLNILIIIMVVMWKVIIRGALIILIKKVSFIEQKCLILTLVQIVGMSIHILSQANFIGPIFQFIFQ